MRGLKSFVTVKVDIRHHKSLNYYLILSSWCIPMLLSLPPLASCPPKLQARSLRSKTCFLVPWGKCAYLKTMFIWEKNPPSPPPERAMKAPNLSPSLRCFITLERAILWWSTHSKILNPITSLSTFPKTAAASAGNPLRRKMRKKFNCVESLRLSKKVLSIIWKEAGLGTSTNALWLWGQKGFCSLKQAARLRPNISSMSWKGPSSILNRWN